MNSREMKREERAFVLLSARSVVLETEREIVVPSSKKITELISRRIASINCVQDTETIIPTHSKTKWPEQS